MKKINHSVLIVSIAAALVIFGCAIVLGLNRGLYIGLISGTVAFVLLVGCMLLANRKLNKKKEEKKAAAASIAADADPEADPEDTEDPQRTEQQ